MSLSRALFDRPSKHFAHAPEIDGVRSVQVESNDVFDWAAQIWFACGGEEDAAGTNVLGIPSMRDTFSPGTSD